MKTCLFIFSFFISALSQDTTSVNYGFVLGISGLDHINPSGYGGVIGLKKKMSDKFYLYGGLKISQNKNFRDEDYVRIYNDFDMDTTLSKTRNENTSNKLFLAGHYYLQKTNSIKIYTGLEASYNWGNTERRDNISRVDAIPGNSVSRTTSYHRVSNFSGYSLGALLGFEWFITSQFSLGAHFSLAYSYTSNDYDQLDINDDGQLDIVDRYYDNDNYDTRTGVSGVLLTVYF